MNNFRENQNKKQRRAAAVGLRPRMIFLIILFLAMGSVLVARLFDLQVLNGESYLNDFTLSIRKERVLKATRGEIYDCNGKLLAYNQLAYSVTLEDVGTYRSNTARNLALNGIIYNTIKIIESHGDSVLKNFRISMDKDGNYVYNTSGFNLNRFKAVDQILHDPVGCPVPLNDFAAVFDIDRPRLSVKTKSSPVPQFKGKDIWSCTDLKHHGISARAVDRACRNQKMIMFFCRNFIDKAFRFKTAGFLCFLQSTDHILRLRSGLYTQINAGILLRIQNVVAFILRIGHTECTFDVICQRMNLQTQVLSVNGIQEIKTDRKFRTEAGIVLLPQKRTGLIQSQIHRRYLDIRTAKPKQK